eukprot:350019-Chlamydomonas_euryale.AAC.1
MEESRRELARAASSHMEQQTNACYKASDVADCWVSCADTTRCWQTVNGRYRIRSFKNHTCVGACLLVHGSPSQSYREACTSVIRRGRADIHLRAVHDVATAMHHAEKTFRTHLYFWPQGVEQLPTRTHGWKATAAAAAVAAATAAASVVGGCLLAGFVVALAAAKIPCCLLSTRRRRRTAAPPPSPQGPPQARTHPSGPSAFVPLHPPARPRPPALAAQSPAGAVPRAAAHAPSSSAPARPPRPFQRQMPALERVPPAEPLADAKPTNPRQSGPTRAQPPQMHRQSPKTPPGKPPQGWCPQAKREKGRQ